MDIDDFKIDVYIPSLRKTVQFGQINNRVYKNILKYTQTKKDINIEKYLYRSGNRLTI